MAQLLTGVTLTAPSSDPSIAPAGTFTMSCTYTVAGHGGEESVDLNWEYSTTSGSGYTAIPTSGTTLSVTTNPTTGSDSTVTRPMEDAGIQTVVVPHLIRQKSGIKFYSALLANIVSKYPKCLRLPSIHI